MQIEPRSDEDSPTLDYFRAARGGSLAAVQSALAAGADLEALDDLGENALLIAASTPHEHVCRFLIDAGISLDAANRIGCRPIHAFSKAGHLALVRLALQHGEPVNYVTDFGTTPLFLAAKYHHIGMVALLLNHGARPEALNNDGRCALHYASAPEIIDLLLAAGTPIDSVDRRGCTPLMCMAWSGDTNACAHLIGHGASVNARAHDQGTALHCATESKHLGVCMLLLEAGADPEAPNPDGQSFVFLTNVDPALGAIYRALLAHRAMRQALDPGAPAPRS